MNLQLFQRSFIILIALSLISLIIEMIYFDSISFSFILFVILMYYSSISIKHKAFTIKTHEVHFNKISKQPEEIIPIVEKKKTSKPIKILELLIIIFIISLLFYI